MGHLGQASQQELSNHPRVPKASMANRALALCLTLGVLCSQGAVIREDEVFTAIQTLLTEPKMLLDNFGVTKRGASGNWDFNRSFKGVTVQIKYKDPADRLKGGNAHIEVDNLKKLIPMARSRRVAFDINFDGLAAKNDGLFTLTIDYTLEHSFVEKGIISLARKMDGGVWNTDLTIRPNGGGSGSRIIPLVEMALSSDRSTFMRGNYNSDRFQKIDFKMDRTPGKKVDSTLKGTFMGQNVDIKLDVSLTVTIGRSTYNFEIDGKRIPGSEIEFKLSGNVGGSPMVIEWKGKRTGWTHVEGQISFGFKTKNYNLKWNVKRDGDVSVKVSGAVPTPFKLGYSRNSDFTKAMLKVDLMSSNLLNVKIARKNDGGWNRKTVIVYQGSVFNQKDGKITLQSKSIDANTKKIEVTADRKKEKEVLKYTNQFSLLKATHNGHEEVNIKMDANMNLKESSLVYRMLCRNPSSIHCFKSRNAVVDFSMNLDEPWHVLLKADIVKDGAKVFDLDVDTKKHLLASPYFATINAPRLIGAEFGIKAEYVGSNIIIVLTKDSKQLAKVGLNSPDMQSPYEFDIDVNNLQYKVIVEAPGNHNFDVKVSKNGAQAFNLNLHMQSPYTIKIDYPATLALLSKTPGTIEGTFEAGKLDFAYKPGRGKNLIVNYRRTSSRGNHAFKLTATRDGESYYDYKGTITYGASSELEMDAESKLMVSPKSMLRTIGCPLLDTLCFTQRDMTAKFRANKATPYKMEINVSLKKDSKEVLGLDMQTKKSPYKIKFNFPRLRKIIAPYRNEPLEITADHVYQRKLHVTTNIRGLQSFNVDRLPNGMRQVSLNGKQLAQADFSMGNRMITQKIQLPNGKYLTTTIKWGNEDNLHINNIEINMVGSERNLDATCSWNLSPSGGDIKFDADGNNNRWGAYSLHRVVKATNSRGIWALKVDGNSLVGGNAIDTDVTFKIDTNKVGNGKLDAIDARIVKVVNGNNYEFIIKDSRMSSADFLKLGGLVRSLLA